MTEEEAKKEIIDMANTLQLIPNTPKGKAVSMALKALEQDNVLDKIRAEIEQLPTTKCTETHRIYIDAYDFKENVLTILDKYKGEIESGDEG